MIFVNARCDSFGVDIRIPIFLFLVDYFVLTAANKADAAYASFFSSFLKTNVGCAAYITVRLVTRKIRYVDC